MRFGYQVSGDRTSRDDAHAQAEALRGQTGCIRAGVTWHPVSFAYPTGRDWYAYGVFGDDPGDGWLPDGTRRVILTGADLLMA